MKKLLILFLLMAFVRTAFCQGTDHEAVKKAIYHALDIMKSGDTIEFKSCFVDKVVIQYIQPKNDTTSRLVTINNDDFLNQMAAYKTDVWDERIVSFDSVNIYNGIAVVWAPYKFYIGKKLSHCGIDIFTLMNTPEGWKIVSVFYSVKSSGCPG